MNFPVVRPDSYRSHAVPAHRRNPVTDPRPYTIEALKLGPMDNFVYLIADRASARAAVVDPAWDVPAVLARAAGLGLHITDALLTHSHHDHINGVEALLEATDARVHLHRDEAAFWGADLVRPALHRGGDTLLLGSTPIEVLHTPGHTPGSVCYRVHDEVITGDTLFVYGCGRCDLKGGDPNRMHDSLCRLCRELPGGTLIRPGHDYGITPVSTMLEQMQGNPFLHFHEDQRAGFVEYRMHLHDREEPYGPEPAPDR